MKPRIGTLPLILGILAVLVPTARPVGAQTAERRALALRKLEETRARLPKFHDDLIRLLDVKAGLTVADVGAGSGAFAARLAQAVGTEGRVFATEISREKVDQLEAMKSREKLPQLTALLGGENDPLLPDRVDRLFLIEVYHHLSHPAEFMAAALKYLKPGGKLAVVAVDVNRWSGNRDPKTREVCISDPAETRAAVEKAGWVFVKMEHPPSYEEMYVLVFEAPR